MDIEEILQEQGPTLIQLVIDQDIEKVNELLTKIQVLVWYRLPEKMGILISADSSECDYTFEAQSSPLHIACAMGNLALVKCLTSHGHQWNVVDEKGVSAGELAFSFPDVYSFMIEEGCRTEMILNMMESREEPDETENDYFSQKLTFQDDRIVDGMGNGVMMGWETPIMELHAEKFGKKITGGRVLNVGFGMGIIDRLIQEKRPSFHCIIEAHPDILDHMRKQGWMDMPNVQVLEGKWQDVMSQIDEGFDAIYFDTFSEHYRDLSMFHDNVSLLLNQGGIYSFFNGLGGTNPFFYDVYSRIVEMDLNELGMDIEIESHKIKELGDEIWQGLARPYWSLGLYRLVLCTMKDD